jgi:MoaA/NifB/PqqE/SkfB family radical SAM enzyme
MSDKHFKYRFDWHYNPTHFVVKDYPLHLDIELNTSCNLRCPMCFQATGKVRPEYMALERVKALIDDGVKNGLCSIKFNYRGEPLLYPNLPEVIAYAKEKGITEVMINTNATLLTANYAKELIDSGLDLLSCSIDAVTEKVYNKIRVGGNFYETCKNVVAIQVLKKLKKSSKPIVRVQMVEQELNTHQVDKFVGFWNEYADEISVVDYKDTKGEEEDATELPDWYCSQLWQRLFVLADWYIIPCCMAIQGKNEKQFVLGSVYNTTIKKAWNSIKMKHLRKAHKGGKSHLIAMCRTCGLRKEVVNQNGR